MTKSVEVVALALYPTAFVQKVSIKMKFHMDCLNLFHVKLDLPKKKLLSSTVSPANMFSKMTDTLGLLPKLGSNMGYVRESDGTIRTSITGK